MAAILTATVSSCDRADKGAANDSGVATDSPRSETVSPPLFVEWTAAAGRQLLVATASSDSALAIFPEFTVDSSLASAHFERSAELPGQYELFAPDGSVIATSLTSVAEPSNGCGHWPLVHISPAPASRLWTIGLQRGRASGILYSSLATLSGRDSARVVAQLARLASQAPHDTTSALRGLPYVVLSAYRGTLPDSQALIFGEVIRRLNIEASPLEERTVVIGEQAPREPRYTLAYSERHAGEEENVPTTDLIGLLQLRNGRVLALASREFSEGGMYLMWERGAPGRWRVRWQSAYAGC